MRFFQYRRTRPGVENLGPTSASARCFSSRTFHQGLALLLVLIVLLGGIHRTLMYCRQYLYLPTPTALAPRDMAAATLSSSFNKTLKIAKTTPLSPIVANATLSQANTTETMTPTYNQTFNDIFWLHIQKTGTSFFTTIYLHFCPRILQFHPEVALQKKLLVDTILLKRFPPDVWCDAKILNMPRPGYHHPYNPKRHRNPFQAFTMLRDPTERLLSAYNFGRHGSQLIKSDNMSAANVTLDMYLAEPQIPNCQTKMILGFHCHRDIVPAIQLNVTLALERIQAPNFFFGVTDRWEESICLFHSVFGGKVQPFELLNNRPTRREFNILDNYTDLDFVLVSYAMELFQARVVEAGCLLATNGEENHKPTTRFKKK